MGVGTEERVSPKVEPAGREPTSEFERKGCDGGIVEGFDEKMGDSVGRFERESDSAVECSAFSGCKEENIDTASVMRV